MKVLLKAHVLVFMMKMVIKMEMTIKISNIGTGYNITIIAESTDLPIIVQKSKVYSDLSNFDDLRQSVVNEFTSMVREYND